MMKYSKGLIFQLSLVVLLVCLGSCESDQATPDPCATGSLGLSVVGRVEPDCGESNGSMTLEATEGEGDYVYSLNGSSQGSGVFEGLSSGTYTFLVTDENDCTASFEATLSNKDGVNITSLSTTSSGCGSSDGTISVVASGGVEPYMFSLNSGSFSSENMFSDLASGSYVVAVKDADDCEASRNVQVATGVTLSGNISPIISSNCAISGCHNGSQSPRLTSASEIISNASRIRSQTASGAMPKTGSLTRQEVDMIACWVEDGALND